MAPSMLENVCIMSDRSIDSVFFLPVALGLYGIPKSSAILAKMSVLAIYVRVKPIYDMKH